MLIFDEKKYAIDLISNGYKTKKNQGRERCVLVRYLNNEGFSKNDIINFLKKMPFNGREFIDEDNMNIIYDKIINKSLDFDFMTDIKVDIYKEEMDTILKLKDRDSQNLLFILMVYYKWAKHSKKISFHSKKNGYDWVLENDVDICKYAKIFNKRTSYRYKIFKELHDSGYYINDFILKKNMFALTFIKEQGEKAFTISNYDDLTLWIDYYNKKAILCKECSKPVLFTNNSQKYCKECAHLIKIKKTVENRNAKKALK